jgi:tRNA threonylcarbamoyladenosine biosynthesis protein TsaE
MPAALEPREQACLGAGQFAVRYAQLLKTQLRSPTPDIACERFQVWRGTRFYFIALHNLNLPRFLADESATMAFGAGFARVLEPGMVIYLTGELGSGKTTLTRGILRGLGYAGRVRSPTFALVEVYNFSKLYLYHFDFYRFDDPRELDDVGFREYFRADAVCLVEWPEKVVGLPPADVHIAIHVSGGGRILEISSDTEAGQRCMEALQPR